MSRTWIGIAAINGLIAVAAGAFGAHALKEKLDPKMLAVFETGVRYQMYHALALLAVAWIMSIQPSRLVQGSAWSMLAGIVLFSGSLYGLSLLEWRRLGPVTPIGGLLLMIGWLLLAISAFRAAYMTVHNHATSQTSIPRAG